MKNISRLSGNLIINPEENVIFECSVFENAIIDANYGNVKFMNCTFLNDICIKNAKILLYICLQYYLIQVIRELVQKYLEIILIWNTFMLMI